MGTLNPSFETWAVAAVSTFGAEIIKNGGGPAAVAAARCLSGAGALAGAWAVGTGSGCVISCDSDSNNY